jgi:hypothetical protein
MPFIEIRGWTRKTAIPYVTNRSPDLVSFLWAFIVSMRVFWGQRYL